MHIVKANHISDIQVQLSKLILEKGDFVKTRNLNTKEIYPVSIELTNIRNRCTTLLERNWNLIFAFGEFLWHISASDDLKFILYYSKNWREVSNDGEKISESCYGKKIFGTNNLWEFLYSELKNDIYSRRAVINLFDSKKTLGKNLKDVACTVSFQFLVRKNKLDLIVNMRSNDLIWGLPNDMFFFTMIQELFALQLNLDVGTYYHQTNSLHVYERHYKLIEKVIENPKWFDYTMPKMDKIPNFSAILNNEQKLRDGEIFELENINSSFWEDLVSILKIKSFAISQIDKETIFNNSSYKGFLKMIPKKYYDSEIKKIIN